MKIAIDARMYGLEHAGIGRYVMNLIDQIEKLDDRNLYYLLLRRKYFKSLKFKSKRFRKVLADYPHYSFEEQFLLPLQLIKLKPGLVHFPHFNVPVIWWGKQVITIHDLIKHQSRGKETTTRFQFLYWLKYFVYRVLLWLAAKRASHLMVPSRYWKRELVKNYRVEPGKIIVTYEGVGEKFQKRTHKLNPKEVVDQYQIKKPFVIYVGSLYPHKNVGRLAKALFLCHESYHSTQKLTLVVVCARNVFYERFKTEIEGMKAEKFVNLVGFVPDEKLAILYQQAEAFVWPTLMEGFGLPPLEAMSLGCPVLLSDIPVLKEICGQAALYFDPYDVNDIAEKIKKITGNQKLKEKLRKLGHEQVKKYSWQKMAKQTLKVYEKTLLASVKGRSLRRK